MMESASRLYKHLSPLVRPYEKKHAQPRLFAWDDKRETHTSRPHSYKNRHHHPIEQTRIALPVNFHIDTASQLSFVRDKAVCGAKLS